MKNLFKFSAFVLAFVASTAAYAQNTTLTNHAFAIGKGPGVSGFTSLLCTSAQLAVGQAAADPICRTVTGDWTLSAAGVATLGAVNANVGTFGSATSCVSVTSNAKGLTTAISAATCTPAVGSIGGLGAGVATFLGTASSANLAAALTDETGTGAAVFGTSPVLVTPNLGTPSAATLTNATGLPVGTGISGLATGVASFLATPTSANLRAALTDEVGTGAAYFVGGALGTPASGTGTNLTGIPNAALVNSSVTVGGTACTLGSSCLPVGKQYIMGGSGANATQFAAATTNFVTPALASTTESLVYLVMPVAGLWKNMFVYTGGAPGVGQTYVVTFRNALADTTITCTVSGAASNTCSDLTHTVANAAGDRWSVKFVTSAGAAATNLTFALEFDSQ